MTNKAASVFLILLGCLLGVCLLGGCSGTRGTTYRVYFLGGQSNMVGFGMVSELPDDLAGEVDGSLIYATAETLDGEDMQSVKVWAPVTGGYGKGYAVSAGGPVLGPRFGPELTFADEIRGLRPDERIALIKYARGGSTIGSRPGASQWGNWTIVELGGDEPTSQYTHAVETIRAAMSFGDLDGDGIDDTLVPSGILWMQGESDGMTTAMAEAYAENLERLMDLLRVELGGEVPIVLGRISDSKVQAGTGRIWPFGDQVRAEQRAFVDEDGSAALVESTDSYAYSDPYHYDSAGYIDLGREMARAMDALLDEDE